MLANLFLAGRVLYMFYPTEAFNYHCQNSSVDKVLLEDLLHFNISVVFQSSYDETGFYLPSYYGPCVKQIPWVLKQVRIQLSTYQFLIHMMPIFSFSHIP